MYGFPCEMDFSPTRLRIPPSSLRYSGGIRRLVVIRRLTWKTIQNAYHLPRSIFLLYLVFHPPFLSIYTTLLFPHFFSHTSILSNCSSLHFSLSVISERSHYFPHIHFLNFHSHFPSNLLIFSHPPSSVTISHCSKVVLGECCGNVQRGICACILTLRVF